MSLLGNRRMPVEVFESIQKMRKKMSGAPFLEKNVRRKRALVHYFSKRGIIQVEMDGNSQAWPRLIYPNVEKMDAKIIDLERKHEKHVSKKREWELTHWKAASKDAMAHAKKVVDPLFWKHVTKKMVDDEYRKSANTIDLHSSLVSDEKYRPMIHAFVHNPEYRKQLTETVKNSLVYQNHKGLAQNARERKKLQMDVSKNMIRQTKEQLREYQMQLQTLRELLKWSKEK